MKRAIGVAVLLCASSAHAATHDLGFNVHQSLDTGVPVTVECGGSIVRIDFNWLQAEPTEGKYDWALFDGLIDGARAKGLRVLATIGYTPAWASQGNVDGKASNNDVPKTGTYEKFVRAAVTRYSDRVQHWELWNEPNLGEFFEGTPQQYVDLILKPGADAVHSVCASCKTLGPDVATLAAGKYDVWMQTVLEQAKDKLDIITGHVYADFPKVEDDTNPSFFSKLDAHRVLKLPSGAIVFEDPLSLRELQVKFGAGSKPFWLTETGKTAKFGDATQMEAQATYTRKVLEAMLARSWWQTTIFYEAFDEPTMSYDWGFALRKTAGGYDLKPACAVVKKAAAQQPLFGGKGTDCSDGLDNEGDGLIDYPADDDCSSASTTSEGAPPVRDAGTDDASTSDDAGTTPTPSEDSGCACRVGPPTKSPWILGILALATFARRRRTRPA